MISVVTGGAGFIGSWLCESLLAGGHKVICIDNFITGSEKNLSNIKKNKNFTLIKKDISLSININEKIDYIFHLASPASPVFYQRYPIETMLANSAGTKNMLELAKKHNARLLFASTSEIYGEPQQHPQTETYWGNVNPVGIRSCYDESKRFGEALTLSYARKHGLDARVARIFNTYGPRMQLDDGRVVPNFIMQSLESKPITVYGNGKQTRSFCYVTDMVDGLKKMMFSEKTKNSVINLGNPEEYTVLEIAQLIKKLAKSKSDIIFKPLPEDDPTRRKPDITKARKMLAWSPTTELEQGLEKTIDFFRMMK